MNLTFRCGGCGGIITDMPVQTTDAKTLGDALKDFGVWFNASIETDEGLQHFPGCACKSMYPDQERRPFVDSAVREFTFVGMYGNYPLMARGTINGQQWQYRFEGNRESLTIGGVEFKSLEFNDEVMEGMAEWVSPEQHHLRRDQIEVVMQWLLEWATEQYQSRQPAETSTGHMDAPSDN